MQDQVSIKLHLKFKDYKIPNRFKGLFDVEENIYSQLLLLPNHEYYVNSDVSEAVFLSFLNYWIKEEEPTVTFENYYEFFQLSQEFHIMQEFLERVKSNFDECEQNIYILKHSMDSNISEIERKIASNLDDYIERHGEKLMSLKIQTLFNIFNDDRKSLTKHNEAYELIKKHYIKNKDDDVFILLCCIDCKSLNKSNFKESILEAKKRFGFHPKNEISFYEDLCNEIKKVQTINEQQKESIVILQETINNQNDRINELLNEINEMKKNDQEKQQKIDKIINDMKIMNMKNEEEEKTLESLNDLKQNIIDIQNELKKHEIEINKTKECKKGNSLNENIDEQVKQELNLIKQQIANLYLKKCINYNENNEFKGIINYLQTTTKDIFKEIEITSSSIQSNSDTYSPKNIILYDNVNVEFCSSGDDNSWILFDFKNHRVIPINYTIRSVRAKEYKYHLRSWAVFGSKDKNKWDILDDEKDCAFLNGPNFVHTFSIQNQTFQEYQFLKIQKTGKNWSGGALFNVNSIEFYGYFNESILFSILKYYFKNKK